MKRNLFTRSLFCLVLLALTAWSAPTDTPKRVYGYIKDSPEGWIFNRDRHYSVGAPMVLPPRVDLRAKCPPIDDQGQLGSCTANSSGSCGDYVNHQQGDPFCPPSRLKIYYDARAKEGTINQDAGAQLRDVLACLCTPKGCLLYTSPSPRD